MRSIGGVQVLLANGASGAPTSGHHIAGEFHTDQAGTAHVCTATGQPGTWSTLGAVGTVDAGTLTGTTLASNVVTSSLTSVGVLAGLSMTGTFTGQPTWASSQAITLSTAAQPNITSVGTLTGLTMGGTLTMGAHTLDLTGATVNGAPTWGSNQALVVSTAAQPNITSLGTIAGLSTSGTFTVGGDLLQGSSTSNRMRMRSIVTLADNGVAQVTNGASDTSFLMIQNVGSSCVALFATSGGNHATALLAQDTLGLFSATATTASHTNVYWSAGNSRYELENKMGGARTYQIFEFTNA